MLFSWLDVRDKFEAKLTQVAKLICGDCCCSENKETSPGSAVLAVVVDEVLQKVLGGSSHLPDHASCLFLLTFNQAFKHSAACLSFASMPRCTTAVEAWWTVAGVDVFQSEVSH